MVWMDTHVHELIQSPLRTPQKRSVGDDGILISPNHHSCVDEKNILSVVGCLAIYTSGRIGFSVLLMEMLVSIYRDENLNKMKVDSRETKQTRGIIFHNDHHHPSLL